MIAQDNILAMFPLKVAVLPGEKINLHIFEPRYIQLIHDCNEDGIHFGIPYSPHADSVGPFGTIVKLNQIIHTYENGEMDVEVTGISTFKISEYYDVMPEKLYGGAYINLLTDLHPEPDLDELYREIFHMYCYEKDLKSKYEPNRNSMAYAGLIKLEKEEKYKLISLEDEYLRMSYLRSILRFRLKIRDAEQEIGIRYTMN